jgi:hypothetical protein
VCVMSKLYPIVEDSQFSKTAKIIKGVYLSLKTEQDLSPHNPVVNQNLTELVASLTLAHIANENNCLSASPFLRQERFFLPKICATAEGEMEKYWADEFLTQDNLQVPDLERFLYYRHYVALWNLEEPLLAGMPVQRLVFLGSGALPLTAILAAVMSGIPAIVCVDSDPAACEASSVLIEKLGLSDRIWVVCNMAHDFDFQPHDTVMCASLVSGKRGLYQVLYDRGVEHFLVRDVEGIYCYLYKPSPQPCTYLYKELQKTRPNSQCINTTRLFRHTGFLLRDTDSKA